MRKLMLLAALVATPLSAQTMVGGRYNSGAPTLSDGEQRTFRLTSDGELLARAGAVTPITVQNQTALLLSAVPNNIASLNIVNSTTAGYVVVANLNAIPASGAALGPTVELYCMPLAANAGFRDPFTIPMRGSVGLVVLHSTSCTTYTPVSPAAISISAAPK